MDRSIVIANKTIKHISINMESNANAWIGRIHNYYGIIDRLYVFSTHPLTNETLTFNYVAFL